MITCIIDCVARQWLLYCLCVSFPRTASSGWLFGGEVAKTNHSKQISRSFGNLIQAQAQSSEKPHPPRNLTSLSQDTGMGLENELALDESMFEQDNSRPRVKSEGRANRLRGRRKRRRSDEPVVSTNSNTDLENVMPEKEEEEEVKVVEKAGQIATLEESNAAIANLLMSSTGLRGLVLEESSPQSTTVAVPPIPHSTKDSYAIAIDQEPAPGLLSEEETVASGKQSEGDSTADLGVNSQVTLTIEEDPELGVEVDNPSQPIPKAKNEGRGEGSNVTQSLGFGDDQPLPSTPLLPLKEAQSNINSADAALSTLKEQTNDNRKSPHADNHGKVTITTGRSSVAELREKFLGFSVAQKLPASSTKLSPRTPVRYSQQRHVQTQQVNCNERTQPPEKHPQYSHPGRKTTPPKTKKVYNKKKERSKDQEDEEEEVKHATSPKKREKQNMLADTKEEDCEEERELILSASRPDLDLSSSDIRISKSSVDTSLKPTSPLALYSRSMSDMETNSQTTMGEKEEEEKGSDDELIPPLVASSDGDREDQFLAPTVHMIMKRTRWVDEVDADDMSSGESDTDLVQPLQPFTGETNTAGPYPINGFIHSSPQAQSPGNNLYHLSARKRSQQRLNDALLPTNLSSAGKPQASFLSSIPEES